MNAFPLLFCPRAGVLTKSKAEAESREYELTRRVAELERELRRTTAQMQSFSEAPDFVDTSASMRRAHDVLARECKGLRQAISPR